MLSVDPNIGGLTSVPSHLSCLKWCVSCLLNLSTASLNKTGIKPERALHISTWWSIIGNLGRFSQTTSAPKGLAGWIISVANKLHGDAKTLFKTSYVYVTAYDGWRARRPVAHDKKIIQNCVQITHEQCHRDTAHRAIGDGCIRCSTTTAMTGCYTLILTT